MKHTRMRYEDGEQRRERDRHSRGKQDGAQSAGKAQNRKKGQNRRRGRGERFVVVKDEKGYTVAYIEALPEGERAELINGELFVMETPLRTHQQILMKLSADIYNHIRKKKGSCEVYPAPFAVRIKKDERNYVEPDISVICDPKKLDEKGCHGAPDWVIEIVSPSSKKMDYELKLKLYREAGVREYWIVDPEREIVTVYDFAWKSACDSGDASADRERRDSEHGLSCESARDSECGSSGETACGAEAAVYPFTQRIKAGIYEDLWIELA